MESEQGARCANGCEAGLVPVFWTLNLPDFWVRRAQPWAPNREPPSGTERPGGWMYRCDACGATHRMVEPG